MNLVFKYDEIVKKFNSDLVNKLRKHGSDENYLNLFKPKYFMPFAGRYTLSGKLTVLNDNRGVTELDDAFEYFTNSKNIDSTKSKCIVLNPNSSFDLLTGLSSEPYTKIDSVKKQKYVDEITELRSVIGNCKTDLIRQHGIITRLAADPFIFGTEEG